MYVCCVFFIHFTKKTEQFLQNTAEALKCSSRIVAKLNTKNVYFNVEKEANGFQAMLRAYSIYILQMKIDTKCDRSSSTFL